MLDQKYAMIIDGELVISDILTAKNKPLRYDAAPTFDQLTEYVVQSAPVLIDGKIVCGVEVLPVDVAIDAQLVTPTIAKLVIK